MCGIAGFYSLGSSFPENAEKLLLLMQQKIVHRGPDGYGVWACEEKRIGFAHRRLSIQDLSDDASQPFVSENKKITLVFNGEIYNHPELKLKLENLGYRYRTNCDTETLIHAYREWGIDFLHKLDGMFSIALFDSEKDELFLIRDRIGIKPLYFSLQKNKLSFASEIKALWPLPWMDKKISRLASYHYYTFMVAPSPTTIFEGVYKLPAGFYCHVDANKNVNFKEWYSPINCLKTPVEKNYYDEQFCVEGVQALISDSVKKRMLADVPVGAFLSGGLDSSLIVALMAKQTSQLKTFNISFEGFAERDERKWARLVASKFGTNHQEIILTQKDAANFYEQMLEQLDEPLADPVCIPFYFLSKAAQKAGVPVVQVGEGADELFFGYKFYEQNRTLYNKFWKNSQRFLPSILRKAAYKICSNSFKNNAARQELASNWANNKSLFWGGAIAFGENHKQSFLVGNKNSALDDEVVQKIYSGIKQNFNSYSFVERHNSKLSSIVKDPDFALKVAHLELSQRLPELLLMRADKMAMAAGIETRVPFLDHKLVEFALKIPEIVKCKNGATKHILKQAALKWLPKELVYRDKIGFGVPIDKWIFNGDFFKSKKSFVAARVPELNNSDWFSKENRYGTAIRSWVVLQHERFKEMVGKL
jgi:asparagine synthase (glutamine-hydrolysing)